MPLFGTISSHNQKLLHLILKFMKITKRGLIISFLIIIFILGMLIRLNDLCDIGFYYDTVETQYLWANTAVSNGFVEFWSNYKGFMDYLPGSIYLGMTFKNISLIFNNSPESYVLILKSFNILVDLFLSYFIYSILYKTYKFPQIKSVVYALIVFLAPGIWFISSYWGQFDNLIVLLTLISFYFLTKNEKIKKYLFVSGLLYGLVVSIKLQPIIFSFIIIIYLISRKNLKSLMIYITGFFISFSLINIPALLINPYRTITGFLQPFTRDDIISSGANTFWTLFPNIKTSHDILWGNISVSFFSYLVFIVIILFSLFVIFDLKFNISIKRNFEKIYLNLNFPSILSLCVITNLTYFMLMPKMHSRYDVFAVTYIMILIAFAKRNLTKNILIFGAICLNISYFFNQLFVFYSWYRDKFYGLLDQFMNNQSVTVILVLLNVFALICMLTFIVNTRGKVLIKNKIDN